MSIVLMIVFPVVAVGLLARRMTPLMWAGLTAWIALVVAFHFFKH